MITKILDQIIGTRSERFIKKYQKTLEKINALEAQFIKLTGEEIRAKIQNIREEIREKNNEVSHLPTVFALVREAAKRTIGHRHYDVQILGGIALYLGYITEMATGEGKTLVATTAVVLRALKAPTHVVTVNAYLAERDCKLMGKIYEYLGLSYSYVTDKTSQEQEIHAFSTKDIIYVSNNQIVFHYLRHLLRPSNYVTYQGATVERKFPQYCAIVDEMDNILIDEARTPFIISTPCDENSAMLYEVINKVVATLIPEFHYVVVFKSHNVFLTDEGTEFLEKVLKDTSIIKENLYSSENNHILHILRNLLKAHHIFRKDIEYAVINNEIVIIDENTGRLSVGRRFSRGLHQALEAKEGLEIQDESETLLSVTYTSFFKEYEILCGMTGTASTEKEEFWETYKLQIIQIPTNRKKLRIDNDIRLYKNRELQLKGVMELIKEKHDMEQPILVVTTNVQESEVISYLLNRDGISHQLLNAKNHKKEAEFIANAGNLNYITIATNMAGRGTDIKLGGNIDFQIEQMLLMSNEKNEHIEEEKETSHLQEEHVADIMFEDMNLTDVQKEKIKNILEAYEPIKEKVKSIGGLCVLTFGMPESEKILLQAIGRAGRQGDPGVTYSLYSIEDDVFKTSLQDSWNRFLFSKIYGDGEEYISGSPILSNVRKLWGIINAQHFRSRKDLNKYENVRNQQRKDFFDYRNLVLVTTKPQELLLKCFEIFIKEDFELYSLSNLQEKFHKDFEDKQQLEDLFYDQQKNYPIEDRVLQQTLLEILDEVWKQHIQEVESIQHGSNLVVYAQKDPFHEFTVMASNAFKYSIRKYRLGVLQFFFIYNLSYGKEESIEQNKSEDALEELMALINKFKTQSTSMEGGDEEEDNS